MQFDGPLIEGILRKRYKRFLADVELDSGEVITVYCPNTGSMKGCDIPGSKVWLSYVKSTTRKYPYTWEIVQVSNHMIGINTLRANSLVVSAIEKSLVPKLSDYVSLKQEVKYGTENSRIDIFLGYNDQNCYVEVKNVTLVDSDRIAYFPDAVSARGQKHLRELMHVVTLGSRGVIFYCVQHTNARLVKPADHIDTKYGELLRQASASGVEILAYQADISPTSIDLVREIPVSLD